MSECLVFHLSIVDRAALGMIDRASRRTCGGRNINKFNQLCADVTGRPGYRKSELPIGNHGARPGTCVLNGDNVWLKTLWLFRYNLSFMQKILPALRVEQLEFFDSPPGAVFPSPVSPRWIGTSQTLRFGAENLAKCG
jgi:hypothetical protein